MKRFTIFLLMLAIGTLFAIFRYSDTFSHADHLVPTIAVLTPTTHPALENIQAGFSCTLDKLMCKTARYHTYNSHANRVLMRAQVAEITNGNYDLVFTIGASATIMMREQLKKTEKKVPQIFAAVANPLWHGIAQNDQEITGVVERYDPATQVSALHMLKPSVKNVAIVFDPTQTPELASDAQHACREFERHGMHANKLEIFGVAEIMIKLSSLEKNIDAIIILIDNTAVSGLDALVKFCNQRAIPLIASDLDSGLHGASLSVGVIEADYGRQAASIAYRILAHHTPAHTIAYRTLDQRHVQLNTRTMITQHLTDQTTLKSATIISRNGECICIKLPSQ